MAHTPSHISSGPTVRGDKGCGAGPMSGPQDSPSFSTVNKIYQQDANLSDSGTGNKVSIMENTVHSSTQDQSENAQTSMGTQTIFPLAEFQLGS